MSVPVIWNIKKAKRNDVAEIAYELEIPNPAAAAFVNRGLDTVEKAEEYCDLSLSKLHDPFLLPDIQPALKRLIRAIDNKEHIHVHGDYDVDGITAASIIIQTLRKLKANFTFLVPHRINDGYDLQPITVEKAVENDVELLISVDCGTLAFSAAKRAKELGLDLIITDHHTPNDDGTLPDCIAVINPHRLDSKYPFPDLAGVGIAFKFMIALARHYKLNESSFVDEMVEYAALGTVADVAPMQDENRIIVNAGCKELANTKKPGVAHLLKVAGINNVNTTSIGFFIGPRINAVGRLADSMTALELLIETSAGTAQYLANQLDTMNKRRQDEQEQVVAEAKALLPDDLDDTSIIVLAAKGWHPGLIGLVAGKIAEEYARPTLVCTINADGSVKGSCRSTRDFHILNALKSPGCIECFNKVGGHAFAAGFSLNSSKIDELRKNLNIYAKKVTDGGIVAVKNIDIDYVIKPFDINIQTYNAIMKLAPFGATNPEPMFLAKEIKIQETSTVGSGKHLKLKLIAGEYGKQWINALYWRHGDQIDEFSIGSLVDVVFRLSMEEYLGRVNLTMIIEDMKLSE